MAHDRESNEVSTALPNGNATSRCRSGVCRLERCGLKARAERQYGLGVKLGYARLGDAQDLADLAEREALVVVEGNHQALALGQRFDRIGKAVLELCRVRLVLGVERVRILDRVKDGDLAAAAFGVGKGPEVVEGEDGRIRDLEQNVAELVHRYLKLHRHLLVSRRT